MTLIVEIAVIVLAGVGIAVAVAEFPRAERPSAAQKPGPVPKPSELLRTEQQISEGMRSTLGSHVRLRPALAEIAARRLTARGLALERISTPDGERLLGEQLWELVRPDRPFPEDRYGPGVSAPELSAMLERLERL